MTSPDPTVLHVHHHDIEAHAASFNEGYDEAVRQFEVAIADARRWEARADQAEAAIVRVCEVRCGYCGNPLSEGSGNCVTDAGRPHVYDEADLRAALAGSGG